MPRCIYCLRNDPDCGFSREHVIPECLGTFEKNLTLIEAVCADCNQHFGDNLELWVGRDTVEGVERYKFGIKPDGKARRSRTDYRVSGGAFSGEIVDPIPSADGTEAIWISVPQVGFRLKGQATPVFFRQGRIPTLEELRAQGFELVEGTVIEFRAKEDEDVALLVAELRARGIGVTGVGRTEGQDDPGPPVRVNVAAEFKIDRTIGRAMCKIAFNYVAHPDVVGKEFVLHDDFNGVRRFIRDGVGNAGDYFDTGSHPILAEEQLSGRKATSGHIVVVDWRGSDVVVQLRLFNMLTYMITLCRGYGGIMRRIVSGHCFDPRTRKATKLVTVNRMLLP